MVIPIASESRDAVDYDCFDLSSMLAAVREQLLQFCPIRCLGRFTTLHEYLCNEVAVVSAVVHANSLLRFEAEVLSLL